MNEPKTILVVDDDDTLRTVLVDKLESEGFTVFSGRDGEEGVALALEHHPDVALFDVMMPVLDGWGALKKIRMDAWGKNARVILLTNRGDMESISKGVVQGTYEYLVKTDWDLEDIVKKIREAV